MNDAIDPIRMLRPRRTITGISAILLPFTEAGDIDWHGFAAHVVRTADAGLTPAVNMDTGYGNLLAHGGAARRARRHARPRSATARSSPGRSSSTHPGPKFDLDAYQRAAEPIASRGGTPVIFQSYGLTALPDPELIAAYEAIGHDCDAVHRLRTRARCSPRSAGSTRSTPTAGCSA